MKKFIKILEIIISFVIILSSLVWMIQSCVPSEIIQIVS